jgi:glutamine cyclotransferase
MKKLVILTLFVLSARLAAAQDVPELEKAERYETNIPVKVIKRVPLPKGYHEGLLFDGKNIWVNNGEKINTWIVDPETGEVLSEIIPPGTFTEGITVSNDPRYWVTDWDEKKLYRVAIKDNKMESDYEISLEPARPTGVVWTGEKLYVITWTRGMGTRYHLMQLDKNERMFRKMLIKGIHEPSQLAWDGKHLWITSWFSQRVYRVDVDTFRVLGSFRSPAKDTTGIAWDGEYFWITGTYADLYKVKVGK